MDQWINDRIPERIRPYKWIIMGATGTLLIIGIIVMSVLLSRGEDPYGEVAARRFMCEIEDKLSELTAQNMYASWAYETNITDYNKMIQIHASSALASYARELAEKIDKFPYKTFEDKMLSRQFDLLSDPGDAALDTVDYATLQELTDNMEKLYSETKVCRYRNSSDCTLTLDKELTFLMATVQNYDELAYYWVAWRNLTGAKVKGDFHQYVHLMNQAAVNEHFKNAAESWVDSYTDDEEDFFNRFTKKLDEMYKTMEPMYKQLHAYVRRKLREHYGESKIRRDGPIPAHLLGNLWAQSWENVLDITIPFTGKPSLNVTPALVAQHYTPVKIFKLAEDFFVSLGMQPMPDSFWTESVLEDPNDGRSLVCHASAWDFFTGNDYRILSCISDLADLIDAAHHEMGHIEYYIAYKKLHPVFRRSPNEAFHEALGDVIGLSATTPTHLYKIKLLDEIPDDYEEEINALYQTALKKIVFLPYSYIVDQFRWGLFTDEPAQSEYNCRWWKLREKYQGLEPPVNRTSDDFDIACKYHVVAGVPYLRYYLSFITQFQFYESLCIAAGQYDPAKPQEKPIHKCDFYGSKEVGKRLTSMMELGSSRPWRDAMEIMTGARDFDAGPLVRYFEPLIKWLEKENKRTGEYIGWTSTNKDVGC